MNIHNDIITEGSSFPSELKFKKSDISDLDRFIKPREPELGGLSMGERSVRLGGLSDTELKSSSARVDEYCARLEELCKRHEVLVGPGLNRSVLVSFDQEKIYKSESLPLPLKKFVMRFNGLCDLICNKILIEGLMEFGDAEGFIHLKESITKESLNNPVLLSSHILDIYSLREKLAAFFFGKYADSIFCYRDQKGLVTKNAKGEKVVNVSVLQKGLKNIENGSMLKVEFIRKTMFSFAGHSVLIKKIDDNNFVLFDPDKGLYRPVPVEGLDDIFNKLLAQCKASEIHMVKGSTFLERLRQKKILMLAQKARVAPQFKSR